jgi:hypothetical protein
MFLTTERNAITSLSLTKNQTQSRGHNITAARQQLEKFTRRRRTNSKASLVNLEMTSQQAESLKASLITKQGHSQQPSFKRLKTPRKDI